MPEINAIAPPDDPGPEFKFGPLEESNDHPASYDPDDDLSAAVKVALLLGMPLLLTGAPDCGKTSVAYWLAWKLELDPLLVHNVKSTSSGRDLLYEFDELGRFRDSQAGKHQPTEGYVRLNALGLAILYSNEPYMELNPQRLTHAALADLSSGGKPFASRFRRRNVVLIDELDKALRDTPNDLLMEVDQMCFRINELNVWVNGQADCRPIVIVTSNSEKSLPEPFLRRCVFHHIAPPDDVRRRQIVERHMHPFMQRREQFEHTMRFFDNLHGTLGRAPGTVELLSWLTVLEERAKRNSSDSSRPARPSMKELIRPTLGILAKTKEDLHRAGQALDSESLD